MKYIRIKTEARVSAFDVESFIIDIRDYIVQKYPLSDLRNQLKANPAINSLCKDEDGIFCALTRPIRAYAFMTAGKKLKHYSQCQGTRNLPFWRCHQHSQII